MPRTIYFLLPHWDLNHSPLGPKASLLPMSYAYPERFGCLKHYAILGFWVTLICSCQKLQFGHINLVMNPFFGAFSLVETHWSLPSWEIILSVWKLSFNKEQDQIVSTTLEGMLFTGLRSLVTKLSNLVTNFLYLVTNFFTG